MDKKTWILIVAALGVAILVIVLLFLRFSAGKEVKEIDSILNQPSNEEVNIRLDQLEKAVAKLITEVGSSNAPTSGTATGSNSSLEAKVNSLQNSVNSLTVTVNQLKTANGQTSNAQSSNNSNQPPVFVPLGWVASSNANSWTSMTPQTFTFNTANYPGMTSVQFSVVMLNYQAGGTSYAQLYNSTDSYVVFGSTISTTSANFVTVTTSSFQMPSGQKTYTLQLLTNNAKPVMVQDAWLQVNFN